MSCGGWHSIEALTPKLQTTNPIPGSFRITCERALRLLRQHRDSLLALLEAFVHDPLISWRLLAAPTDTTNPPPNLPAAPATEGPAATAAAVPSMSAGALGASGGGGAGTGTAIASLQAVLDGEPVGAGGLPPSLGRKLVPPGVTPPLLEGGASGGAGGGKPPSGLIGAEEAGMEGMGARFVPPGTSARPQSTLLASAVAVAAAGTAATQAAAVAGGGGTGREVRGGWGGWMRYTGH